MYYLDNSATTRPYPEVVETVSHSLYEGFGNPSSLHSLGFASEQALRQARKTIAATLGAKEKEITFTSGGTEANNIAILGYLRRNRRKGNHVMVSAVEHASVLNIFRRLEEEGYRVSYIPVSREGSLDYAFVERELCEETALVSVMQVNNEVGSRFDIPRIRRILEEKKSGAVLHSDCVQAYGKVPFSVKELGADLVTVSAHKVHGPKGVGALYVREGLLMEPVLFGGGQENGLRNGTENLSGIAGFAKAAELTMRDLPEKIERMREIQRYFIEELRKIKRVEINTPPDNCAPHIVNASFLGIRSEILLHTLEQKEVYVSSGSACASNDKKHKKVLEVMGHDRERADSSVRFSFSTETTMQEIREAAIIIREAVEDLQRKLRIR